MSLKRYGPKVAPVGRDALPIFMGMDPDPDGAWVHYTAAAQALEWYAEQARAAARYINDPSKAGAMLAVLTAMALDNGLRAETSGLL